MQVWQTCKRHSCFTALYIQLGRKIICHFVNYCLKTFRSAVQSPVSSSSVWLVLWLRMTPCSRMWKQMLPCFVSPLLLSSPSVFTWPWSPWRQTCYSDHGSRYITLWDTSSSSPSVSEFCAAGLRDDKSYLKWHKNLKLKDKIEWKNCNSGCNRINLRKLQKHRMMDVRPYYTDYQTMAGIILYGFIIRLYWNYEYFCQKIKLIYLKKKSRWLYHFNRCLSD